MEDKPKRFKRTALQLLTDGSAAADFRNTRRRVRHSPSLNDDEVDREEGTNNVTPEKDLLLCSPVRELPEEPLQLSQVLVEAVDSDEESVYEGPDNVNGDDEEQDVGENVMEDDDLRGATNRLVNMDNIRNLIQRKCVCKGCVASGRGNGKLSVYEVTYGLATTVYLTCATCPFGEEERTIRCIPGSSVPTLDGISIDQKGRPPPAFGDYVVNNNAVLMMQNLGIGLEGLRSVLAHLGISHTVGNYSKWKKLQDAIGEIQQELAKECVKGNRIEEIKVSKAVDFHKTTDGDGTVRQGLVSCQDAAWTKRASGTSFSSPNGHYTMFGGFTGKIIGYNCYSKICKTCAIYKNKKSDDGYIIPPPEHRCPLNYEGSAKSMEAAAAVKLTKEIYDETTNLYVDSVDASGNTVKENLAAYINTTIMDDDSTTTANLQLSLQERLDSENAERKRRNEAPITKGKTTWWPYKLTGKNQQRVYVPDHGKLPRRMLGPAFFWADPSHRTKVLGKHLYTEFDKKKNKFKIDKTILDRLKRNFGYGLKQSVLLPRDEFYDNLRAGIDHEFDDHSRCGDWCTKKNLPPDHPERRNHWKKTDYAEDFERLSNIYDSFLTEERLTQMYHTWNTQKAESINRAITATCPKDMVFCQTMQFADRVSWVVVRDSIGGQEGILRLYEMRKLGVPWPETAAFYGFRDTRRSYWRANRMKVEVKKKRKADQKEKWRRDSVADQRAKRLGQSYGAGIGFDGTNAAVSSIDDGGTKARNNVRKIAGKK